MLTNYLKIAFRTIWKNKTFSFINIAGLTLGLLCSMLIVLWVYDEFSVDRFHVNLDRIYSVASLEYMEGEVRGSYDNPGLLGEELPKIMPEVELACSMGWSGWRTFASGDKKMKLPGNHAGKDFFRIFSYPLLEGTIETALNDPEGIAISEKMAKQFFGNTHDALGQALKFENYRQVKVTAVFKDIPALSSEQFEYMLSWDFFKEREPWVKDWHNSGPRTFVLLKEGTQADQVNTKIREIISKYDKEYKESDRLELFLQPYAEKYLHANFKEGKVAGGRIEYVRLFSFVALFILLIACINFMNLSTARSLKRTKEIAVRKVNGAVRSALFNQFMGEAFIYTLMAMLISTMLLISLLPFFNQMTAKQIKIPFNQPYYWWCLAGILVFTSFLAGSYPALLLSSFRPMAILKNNLKLSPSSGWLRKGLVIFQFVLCIVFISSMMIIGQQVDYIQSKNLGYQKSNLIYLPITGTMSSNFEAFKDESLKIPGITHVSKMSQRPLEIENTTGGVNWEGKDPNTFPRFTQLAAGYDFVKTMEAEMASGREFSKEYADSSNYIINETAVSKIGFKDPIGKPFSMWGVKGHIVGVIKDFHFNTLRVPIEPLIIRLIGYPSWGVAIIRIESNKTKEVLASLEKLHNEMNPDFPFAHQFADEEYGYLYTSEQLVRSLSKYFTALAILISCMGLLGLVVFAAEQRIKEIGIRKVLGASVSSLFTLLSKDFMNLIMISFLIAVPVAWIIMNQWLHGFAFRIPISYRVFIFAGLAAFAIAFVTLSYHAFRTAVANPINSLRNE